MLHPFYYSNEQTLHLQDLNNEELKLSAAKAVDVTSQEESSSSQTDSDNNCGVCVEFVPLFEGHMATNESLSSDDSVVSLNASLATLCVISLGDDNMQGFSSSI